MLYTHIAIGEGGEGKAVGEVTVLCTAHRGGEGGRREEGVGLEGRRVGSGAVGSLGSPSST